MIGMKMMIMDVWGGVVVAVDDDELMTIVVSLKMKTFSCGKL